MTKQIIPGCGGSPPKESAQAKAEDDARKEIEILRVKSVLTNEEILNSYCDSIRASALVDIAAFERFLENAQSDRDYVATYGTDEG